MSTAHDPVPVAPESVSANPRAFDVTHRGVFAIAVPMTLAYLSTPILGIVDTTVIGRLGDAALLGGIAVGAIIFDLIFTTFNCLRSSTTGLTAQALGAGNDTEMRATLYRSVIIALICGVAVVALQVPILAASLLVPMLPTPDLIGLPPGVVMTPPWR